MMPETDQASGSDAGNGFTPSWEQLRIMRHVFDRKFIASAAQVDDAGGPLLKVDQRFRERARGFAGLAPVLAELGVLPGELRLSVEPLHPLPPEDHDALVAERIRALGVPDAKPDHGLSLLSRGLLEAHHPGADLLGNVDAPVAHDDLFLFDPFVGFLIWREGVRIRNGWLGNVRDLVTVANQDEPLRSLLVRQPADHFSIGKNLLLREVGPLMVRKRPITFDSADIPTLVVESQRDLEALAQEVVDACERASVRITPFFRGQNSEYRIPERSRLALAGVCPYSDVRDHSIVPSLYRHYDSYLRDLPTFRAFAGHLLDWALYADLIFGDPTIYLDLEGRPYTPRPVPPDAQASIAMAFSGERQPIRAFDDLGPYNEWTITDRDGNVTDRYIKKFRPGHDSVRRSLILQHYGAPTAFVDVTRDVRIAEWFALRKITVDSHGLSSSGRVDPPFSDPAIYVFLVPDGMVPVVHTESLVREDEALRPHRQACAVLGGPGNLYRNAVSRFIALKIKFADGFIPHGLPTARHLFPGPDEDNALKRLLELYRAPADLVPGFPVYWFPPDGAGFGGEP